MIKTTFVESVKNGVSVSTYQAVTSNYCNVLIFFKPKNVTMTNYRVSATSISSLGILSKNSIASNKVFCFYRSS